MKITGLFIARILIGLLLVYPLSLLGQYTQTTATIVDVNGTPYANCGFTVSFVGQNTVPGHPPYTLGGAPGGQFQQQVGGSCTSAAVLSTSLADNNQISPLPSQWEFAICDQTKAYCFKSLCTVTGTTADLSACINANAVTLPLGGGGIIGAVQGQPIYGTGGTTATSAATELAADNLPGADICQKVNAAIAALPANGGTILLSARNYPACAASITVNKRYVTIRGAGMGNFALGSGATILNFASGVSGIVGVTAPSHNNENMVIEDMFLQSASTVAGTDDGITMAGGSSRISRVVVRGFGRYGVNINDQTDFWRMDNVLADSNKSDGFYFSPGCTDENLGVAVLTSATNNGGYGYNLQCGVVNVFQAPHANNNTTGGWNVNTGYSYFTDIYVETGTGSSFILGTSSGYNRISFVGFGQPNTITDSSPGNTNSIQWDVSTGDGQYTGRNGISLSGQPQNTSKPFYSWVVGTNLFGADDMYVRDRKNSVNIEAYVPASGFNFLRPVKLGTDNSIAGSLIIANGSIAAHTTVTTQATGNTAFALPATNGASGNCLVSDGSGNTSWSACGTGPGGGAIGPNGTFQGSNGSGGFTALHAIDNGTTIIASEPLNATTLSTGSSPPLGCPASGCFALSEASAAGTPTLGVDYCRADSTSHGMMCSYNNSSEFPLGSGPFNTVGSGTNTNALLMGTGGSLGTSGTGTITATGLSGTPALPNGTTATTQAIGDSSNKVATDAFVAAAASGANPAITSLIEQFCGGTTSTGSIGNLGWDVTTIGSAPVISGLLGVYPHRCILQLATATSATQGQGGSMSLGAGGSANAWGDFGSNTNWSIRATFSLTSTVSSILRIGLVSQVNVLRGLTEGLVYDTNSPLSAAAMSTMTCTAAVCTVTMSAAHALINPGQGFTIAGASCPSRSGINTTYAYGTATGLTITSTTAFTFNSTGSSETCTAGTVTTVPQADFGFITQSGTVTTGTAVDSGIAADTNWHTIVISSTTAGSITFKLDSGTPVTISTNVPTTGEIPAIVVGTDITAQKAVQLNYWNFLESGLTR